MTRSKKTSPSGRMKSFTALAIPALCALVLIGGYTPNAVAHNDPNAVGHNDGHNDGAAGGVQIKEPKCEGRDVFDLTLAQTKVCSRSKNFRIVGHSYFKGPWLTPAAIAEGVGAGFNTPGSTMVSPIWPAITARPLSSHTSSSM